MTQSATSENFALTDDMSTQDYVDTSALDHVIAKSPLKAEPQIEVVKDAPIRVKQDRSRDALLTATPVLSNGGAERGLPISCFLNAVDDSLDSIVDVWNENVWLASNGGGIGTYWGNVRSIGERIGQAGKTSGIIPFIRVMDSLTLAISQGSLRRGSAAVYLDIHHPEIEEFLEIRKPSGDFNRKSLNLHHGLNITDEFMEAVRDGTEFGLRSPKTNEVIKTVPARKIWQKILEMRLQTGEPYMVAPSKMAEAKYSAMRERSVGLGLMGFHSMLQARGIPFESAMAKSFNNRLFRHIRRGADAASVTLANERGACPDAAEMGVNARFSHKMAVAPTASISIICGGTSAGIEPIPANIYTHKTLSGSFTVRNKHLEELLESKGLNKPSVWTKILENEGSVQHMDELTQHEKDTFKTAFEIDQRWVIEHAADRAPMICQAQSLNIFIPGDVDKWDLHMLHWTAWEKGVKSLYYCRSKSVQRAAFAGTEAKEGLSDIEKSMQAAAPTDYEECLACQ